MGPTIGLLIAVAAFLTALAACIHLVVVTYEPTPWFDEWDTIWLLRHMSAEPGNWFSILLSQHNEHRLFFPRLIFLADFWVFGGKAIFTLASSLVIWVAEAALFCVISYQLPGITSRGVAAIAVAAGALLFSGHQASNFIWSFEVLWFLEWASASLAIFSAVVAATSASRAWLGWLVVALCAGVVANFSMANGNLIWPVLGFAAFRAPASRAPVLVGAVGFAALVCWILYFHGYATTGPNPLAELRYPGRCLSFFVAYLGGPFAVLGTRMAQAVGAVEVALALWVAWRLATAARQLTPLELTTGLIIAFAVGAGLLTTLGRAEMGLDAAVESRYSIVALVLLNALALFYFARALRRTSPVHGDSQPNRIAQLVPMLFAIFAAAYVVVSYLKLPYNYEPIVQIKQPAKLAMLVGAYDSAAMSKVSFDPTRDFAERQFLQKAHRSIFATWAGDELGRPFAPSKLNATACIGNFDDMSGLGASSVKAYGWAWDPSARHRVQHIILVQDGRISGVAEAAADRPDVRASHPDINARTVGWIGYAVLKRSGPVAAYGLSGSGTCYLGARNASPAA